MDTDIFNKILYKKNVINIAQLGKAWLASIFCSKCKYTLLIVAIVNTQFIHKSLLVFRRSNLRCKVKSAFNHFRNCPAVVLTCKNEVTAITPMHCNKTNQRITNGYWNNLICIWVSNAIRLAICISITSALIGRIKVCFTILDFLEIIMAKANITEIRNILTEIAKIANSTFNVVRIVSINDYVDRTVIEVVDFIIEFAIKYFFKFFIIRGELAISSICTI